MAYQPKAGVKVLLFFPVSYSGHLIEGKSQESLLSWKLHGNGKSIGSGEVVSTDERLSWPRTIGVGVALFGMIGVLGARIWIEGKVDFANSTNLIIAASALIIGISDMSWTRGDYTFSGIINATLVAILGYRILTSIASARGNK